MPLMYLQLGRSPVVIIIVMNGCEEDVVRKERSFGDHKSLYTIIFIFITSSVFSHSGRGMVGDEGRSAPLILLSCDVMV